MRRVIRRLLEKQPGFEIVGEAGDFAQTAQVTSELKPEIILIDLYMPNLSSLGSPPRLEVGRARVIAISIFNDDGAKELAASLGAVRLLDKANLYAELIPTIMAITSETAGAAG
jgi:DNA-binding NarL/FixJ family response regulator